MQFNNVEQITEYVLSNPYTDADLCIEKGGLRLVATCNYRNVAQLVQMKIKCNVNGYEYCNGSVDANIDASKFNLQSSTVVFSDLFVSPKIQQLGVGMLIMSTLIKLVNCFVILLNPEIEVIKLRGWLSSVDYKNGNWRKSLPFYQKVAKENSIDVVFKGRKSEEEYCDWRDFIDSESGNDGDVIFLLHNT